MLKQSLWVPINVVRNNYDSMICKYRIKGQLLCAALSICSLIFAHNNWSNWGNTQTCTPCKILYPETREEVQALIVEAVRQKVPLRAVGSGHSWSDVVCTNGYLVTTDRLNRILSIDTKTCQVKVECGIKIKDLVLELAAEGLALSNQGFITEQSIVGALSTATHGSGHTGTLSDFIVEMEIIDGRGRLQTVSESSHSDWLPAVRVGLGATGFVYSVTLQCEPLFCLSHERVMIPFEQMLETYKELYQNNDFCTCMVHPSSRKTLLYLWNKTAKPITRNFLKGLKNDVLFNYAMNYTIVKSMSYFPRLGNKCFESFLDTMQESKHIEYSYKSLSPLKDPLATDCYIETEYAIPFESFVEALQKVLTLFDDYERKGIYLFGIVTCRFGPAQTRAYMSPNYGRETAYININIFNCFPEYEEFFKEFEQILEVYEGRPHWGKFHSLTKEKLATLYKDNFKKFNNVRKQIDPYNIFANEFVTRCFGV